MILETILNIIVALGLTLLGAYILFVGRRALWVTLGILGLWATANLLAIYVADLSNGGELLKTQNWILIGISLAVGVVGMVIGRVAPHLAGLLIGFISGADIALWLYDIVAYIVVDLAHLSEQFVTIVSIILVIIGGLVGWWFVMKLGEQALILITMIIGVELILDALGLNPESSWTAAVILGLALAGVLVQYAAYLRELKAENPESLKTMSEESLAFFQEPT